MEGLLSTKREREGECFVFLGVVGAVTRAAPPVLRLTERVFAASLSLPLLRRRRGREGAVRIVPWLAWLLLLELALASDDDAREGLRLRGAGDASEVVVEEASASMSLSSSFSPASSSESRIAGSRAVMLRRTSAKRRINSRNWGSVRGVGEKRAVSYVERKIVTEFRGARMPREVKCVM
jgi:hypothetical protein